MLDHASIGYANCCDVSLPGQTLWLWSHIGRRTLRSLTLYTEPARSQMKLSNKPMFYVLMRSNGQHVCTGDVGSLTGTR